MDNYHKIRLLKTHFRALEFTGRSRQDLLTIFNT